MTKQELDKKVKEADKILRECMEIVDKIHVKFTIPCQADAGNYGFHYFPPTREYAEKAFLGEWDKDEATESKEEVIQRIIDGNDPYWCVGWQESSKDC